MAIRPIWWHILQNRTIPRQSHVLQKSHQANAPRHNNIDEQQQLRDRRAAGNKVLPQWGLTEVTNICTTIKL